MLRRVRRWLSGWTDGEPPRAQYFGGPGGVGLQRVCLFDDDPHKVLEAEQGNLVRVPRWDPANGADRVIEYLVDGVLAHLGPAAAGKDLRACTGAVEAHVAARIAEEARARANPEEIDLDLDDDDDEDEEE